MAGYRFEEYPKWVNGVIVQSAAEEKEVLATLQRPTTTSTNAKPVLPPSSAATRMRRSRERRKEGKRAVRFDISVDQIKVLVWGGDLDAAKAGDIVAVAQAIERLLEHLSANSSATTAYRPLRCERALANSAPNRKIWAE